MASAHEPSSTPFPSPGFSSAGLGFRADVESVARMWVTAAYDDLRRAGPDRAKHVRRILDGYVLPWFAPKTTTVGDISYFMVHDWLLHLVGRRLGEQAAPAPAEPVLFALGEARELYVREVAARVSVSTVRRRWRDGELVGAYRDSDGRVRIPEATAVAVRRSKWERRVGLSQPVVADGLWVLRRVLAFSRANGIVSAGFDPTEGLDAPRPEPAVARARRPVSQLRPLSFSECARIAAHLHPVHQLVLWLQRVMGLRIRSVRGAGR
ncbi:MAG: hypothetical protein JO337_07580 [Acidimicrobiales bacterium]|nr:hypothetical protein [Acidimicrobiales bacterium]